MLPYNIEIFDRSFNLIQHYNVEFIDYSFDYLSVQENTFMVPFSDQIQKGDYVRIKNDVNEFQGYISSISVDENFEGYTNIGFRPIMGLFDTEIMFSISLQNTGTLEQTLANLITAYFISNTDTDQNIYGLSVETISSTSGWTFYITEQTEGTGKAIINLLSLIQSALTKYSVALHISIDFENKSIKVEIGDRNISAYVIEADLPSVIERSVIVNENKDDTNKMIIYNQADLSQNTVYYLHPDGTYNTTNNNRITPVVYEMIAVSVKNGGTFANAAKEAADKQFGNIKQSNLIEIRVLNDDSIIRPKDIDIGQLVTVITNGTSYGSMLTGYEIGETTKLTFGTIRLDLTKILKEAMK